jgi:hypothetical protein
MANQSKKFLVMAFGGIAISQFCDAPIRAYPEKWIPVFGKDHALKGNLDHDPIQLNRIMV